MHHTHVFYTDRVIEGGDSSCSGLKEEEYMSGHCHLNTAQLAFFKKWFSLAMEEFTYSQVNNQTEPIWRKHHTLRSAVGMNRYTLQQHLSMHREERGSCISSLLPREPTVTDGHRVIQEFVRADRGR